MAYTLEKQKGGVCDKCGISTPYKLRVIVVRKWVLHPIRIKICTSCLYKLQMEKEI